MSSPSLSAGFDSLTVTPKQLSRNSAASWAVDQASSNRRKTARGASDLEEAQLDALDPVPGQEDTSPRLRVVHQFEPQE
jgi:hypothetical protein